MNLEENINISRQESRLNNFVLISNYDSTSMRYFIGTFYSKQSDNLLVTPREGLSSYIVTEGSLTSQLLL